MRAQGLALPILNLAAWVERANDTIVSAHISVGPAGPIPFRARKTEEFLAGKAFSDQLIAEAQESLLAEAVFRTSPARATAQYRQQLVVTLLKNALTTAWQRAA